jgi:hypothetical protein
MRLFLTFLLFSIIFTNNLYSQLTDFERFEIRKKHEIRIYNKANKKTKYMQLRNKYQLKDTSLIDTNVVYIYPNGTYYYHEWERILEKKDTFYFFERFFKNGQYFISGKYPSMPTDEECNNIDYGLRGYYKIINDSILITEVFIVGFGEGYSLRYYNINKDGMYEFESRIYQRPLRFFCCHIENSCWRLRNRFFCCINKNYNDCTSRKRYKLRTRQVNFYSKATW